MLQVLLYERKIMKTPVLDFKDIEQSEEIIEGDALDSWLSELI